MPIKEINKLWTAFVAGEEEAFSELFMVFYPQLYRYGLKLVPQEETVKDSIQDTFLYLYENRNRLSTKVSNVQSYLLTTFRRNLIRKQQQQRKTDQREASILAFEQPFTIAPDEVIIRYEYGRQKERLIHQLLDELPPRQREILYLKYYHGQSMSDIAESLAITYQTVANHLHRALKKLRGSDQIGELFKTALILISQQLS